MDIPACLKNTIAANLLMSESNSLELSYTIHSLFTTPVAGGIASNEIGAVVCVSFFLLPPAIGRVHLTQS